MMSDLLAKILGEVIVALPWTLAMTGLSFAFGALLAIPLCGLRTAHNPVLRNCALSLILTFRSIPPIVWLFLIFFGVGSDLIPLSPFVSAVIGLGLITAANVAEIYRGALKAVPAGQYEAARALGLPALLQYHDVLIPQIFRLALPSLATYAIGLLKDTAVASTIGVHDLAFSAYRVSQETFRGIEVYAAFGLVYFLISLAMAYATRGLDRRLRERISR
ncbi:amino acid ABC transporter permease [Paraburkholderia phymatum]|uniref:Polar amino acid ABC transporter, inner membrane subunit n=1 Tax=Paraburkholderia phymatum (strain DSM 17167 / CIP 108236 / LMG 21445 / STM815) TaxID=391038 RepID=B2JSE5_PARP8|nr:amino acid ABC transporter permease [Paraburkholderia phymatum]ACC73965.1 polar amino acid ABC transporter, inner membrane subunit [Paraburkholderia phymatum STM815]